MKTLIILISLMLTGCANTCTHACLFGFIGPGNSMFDAYAEHADKQDPCQFKGKAQGYTLPEFCGANTGKTVRITKTGSNTYRINQY